jgi:hypothetical protein
MKNAALETAVGCLIAISLPLLLNGCASTGETGKVADRAVPSKTEVSESTADDKIPTSVGPLFVGLHDDFVYEEIRCIFHFRSRP